MKKKENPLHKEWREDYAAAKERDNLAMTEFAQMLEAIAVPPRFDTPSFDDTVEQYAQPARPLEERER